MNEQHDTNIKADALQTKSKDEVYNFIREKLKFKSFITSQLRYIDHETIEKQHRRFEMSGYEETTGECTKHNLAIVNEFADLGIYDYTNYLFLDFYKGQGTLYLQYFHESEHFSFDLVGYGTVKIIYEIFEKTIFSGKSKRRRY